MKRSWLVLLLLFPVFSAGRAWGADLRPDEIVTVLPKDAIPAILSPRFKEGRRADFLRRKTPIIGVEINGDSRAYPVPILSRREIVNDRVGGIPIAVTWWPLCYTAIVYDRRIAGKELTFGVSGKLHANSLIMYDHQTDSLWSHLAGAAVQGPLQGEKLKPIESMFTQWKIWIEIRPDTQVLTTGQDSLLGGSMRDPYDSYYESANTGIIPTRLSDTRVYPKEYVLGFVARGKAKAYPFSALSKQPVVNDVFEGESILVVFDEESATGTVFSRNFQGRTLTFEGTEGKGAKRIFLVDDLTGSTWNGLTGKAIQGPMKGQKLEPRPVTPSFWFGWVDHYPKTAIFGEKK